MRPTTTTLLCLLACTAFTACKPGARDYCERYAKAQCRFQYQCCNAVERQELGAVGFGVYHYDEQSCVDELTRVYCAALAPYADAEEQGRATWDHEKANECLATHEQAASECDAETVQRGSGDEGCALTALVVGAVDDGDTCFTQEECASEEARCLPNEPEEGGDPLVTAKGTCTAPPAVGEECPDFSCAGGAYCDAAEDPRVCKALKGEDDACAGNNECASGVCSFAGGSGVCSTKKANDEACLTDLECESGYCDGVADVCGAKRGVGEACEGNNACLSGRCDFTSGQCAPADGEATIDYDICAADEQ